MVDSSRKMQTTPRNSHRRKFTRTYWVLAFAAGAVLACGVVYVVQMGRHGGAVPFGRGGFNTTRVTQNRNWAQPLKLPGVENFYKVSEQLYRGAQPTAEGMEQLKKLGIKTVVNLRSLHSDRDEIGDANLGYEHITMKPWHPEDKEVVRFLKIVSDPNRTPVLVHCQRGADRTGTMCAVYRVAVQHWSKTDAIKEMTKGGFGFFDGWDNIVNYIRELDIDEIKRRAGVQAGQ
ncbi:MAG TPA: tyrosine-protein phosphatase [Sedimentisphaerales bacterium]|nr:tyrosine-protein phosphatase [Sedimentisphaerales bacterium]